MGDTSKRRETTEFAVKKIQDFIDRKDFTSVVLISSIYVEMRLRTLITLRLNPPEKNWESTSRSFINLLGYKKLLSVCSEVGLLDNCMNNCDKQKLLKNLKDLYAERCKIAHETKIWRGIDEEDKKQISSLCDNAIQFLKNTTNIYV